MRAWNLRRGPMHQRDFALLDRAYKYFESWAEVLKQAKIPAKVQTPGRQPKYPTAESVLMEIRKRHKKGLTLNTFALQRGSSTERDGMLVYSAWRYFGSWAVAVNQALKRR